MSDSSNGYNEIFEDFIASRSPTIGVGTVRAWARALGPGASVFEFGCGNGIPITRTLTEEGIDVEALDASPRMVEAFRANFPDIPVTCCAAQDFDEDGRIYDGVLACGLMFLLTHDIQQEVIGKAANLLKPGGRFLFTAPKKPMTWTDAITGLKSISLGIAGYHVFLTENGLTIVGERDDEGGNYYIDAVKG